MGKKISIRGKVHNVGYRLFLLDGEDLQLNEFVDFVNSNFPEKAAVESISVEDYTGKIRDIDKFRQSFNTVQLSKIVHSGLEISGDTKFIKEGISSIKEDTKYIQEIRDDTKEIKINTSKNKSAS